jgi:hypothetical protein
MLHILDSDIRGESLLALIFASSSLRSFACDNLEETDACLSALAAYCPLLQVLSYGGVSPYGVGNLTRVLRCCPLIEVVEMSSVTDAQMAAVMQHCRNLRAYSAFARRDVSDATLFALAARVQNMRHLSLYGYLPENDAPMLALAQNCHNLWTLEICMQGENISQEALTAVVSNLTSVTELNFEETDLSDAVLMAVARSCPQLRTLHLNSCYGESEEGRYTEHGMAALAVGCASLRKVYVDEDDAVLAPVGRRMWKALQPQVEFDFKFEASAWSSVIHDIERDEFVIW